LGEITDRLAIERAPIGEPEQNRLAIVEEYTNDLRAIIKRDRDGRN